MLTFPARNAGFEGNDGSSRKIHALTGFFDNSAYLVPEYHGFSHDKRTNGALFVIMHIRSAYTDGFHGNLDITCRRRRWFRNLFDD